MGILSLCFESNKQLKTISLRLSELEARQARTEKTLARQRRVNETLIALLDSSEWAEMWKSIDITQAIE